MAHSYTAFGLTLHCNRQLTELQSNEWSPDEAPDILVRWNAGATSRYVELAELGPTFASGNGDNIVLTWRGAAAFSLHQGREIHVDPAPGAPDETVRTFLLGGVLGVLLQQRGWTVIHGSAVDVAGKAVVCAGPSGAGKSTLAAALVERGHRLIEDDTTPIQIRAGVAVAVSGTPRMKLRPDAAAALGLTERLGQNVLNGEAGKRWMHHKNDPGVYPLARVYFLARGAEVAISPVGPADAVVRLVAESYGAAQLESVAGSRIRRQRFENAAALAAVVSVNTLQRPWDLDGLDSVAEAIEHDLEQTHQSTSVH